MKDELNNYFLNKLDIYFTIKLHFKYLILFLNQFILFIIFVIFVIISLLNFMCFIIKFIFFIIIFSFSYI